MTIDLLAFRRTMGLLATGVTVITAWANSVPHGMTATAVTAVSLEPLLILVCINRQSRMCGVIVQARRFAINVLSARQESLSRHFSGQPVEDIPILFTELHSIPTLPDSLATLICSTNQVFDGGDHIIVLGQVEAFMRPECEGAPLIYYAGRYQQLATILG